MSQRRPFAAIRGMIAAILVLPLLGTPLGPASAAAVSSAALPAGVALPAGYVDVIAFGDPRAEAAHDLTAEFTSVVDGALGQKARVANPTSPPGVKGGELRFDMRVDPVAQNYFTLKFWGSDVSPYKTIAYINGEQIGYRRSGDYEAINAGASRPLVGRFYYNTVMLPLEHTQGQRLVEIMVRTYDAGFATPVTGNSRGYYKAYTHTSAYLDVSGERQGAFTPNTTPAPDGRTEAEKQAMIDGYTASQVALFDAQSATVDGAADRKLSIVRYQDDLRFYAGALLRPWCPADTPALKRAALQRIFKVVDNHVKDYYGNTRLLLRGGHQGDWGGYYGALGEALYIVENLIADDAILGTAAFEEFLDQPFVTGTQDGPTSLAGVDWSGGELSRREAWERVLKANFDFARSRLSYIYNQVLYTYEGAWEAHEGLRVVGSAFYEGKARSHRIFLEAIGVAPFLGEEVLVGPQGQDLDLYHSLFYHDTTARFTDDYVNIVGKGLAKSKLDAEGNVVRRLPYGEHYTGITKAGLTRENTYVANYGETANYLPEYFYKTLGHAGDETLNDEILKLALKNIHARGFTRYTDVDDGGNRIMRMEQVVDERNTAYPGLPGYVLRISEGKIMHFASLEKHLADHPERYAGAGWEPYWRYAAEAVGFAQQQLADNQFFNNFASVADKRKYDLRLADTYAYVTGGRADYERFGRVPAGVVHPQTDFSYYPDEQVQALAVDPADYERFAWVDVDNAFVSLRDGDTRIFGSLFERQRGYAGNGRLHVLNGDHDNIVQVATDGQFASQDYYLRMDNIDVDFMEDQQTGDGALPQALAGEIAPVTYQPGVGTVNRENFYADTPYSGYPDFLTSRYGSYLFAFNTTRAEYGNKRDFQLDVPSAAVDLVSGRRVAQGTVRVPAESAMVLRLDSAVEATAKPHHVDYAAALRGNGHAVVTWKAAAGAESYTVKRNGRVVATRVRATHYVDRSAQEAKAYSYTVTAVNSSGSGWESPAAELSAVDPQPGVWRADRIGDATRGTATVKHATIAVTGANGAGLGAGDDYYLDKRDIRDSFLFVHRVLAGSGSVSARIDAHAGPMSGIVLRDQLTAGARYIYFGAGADGNLVLQNRTRDSHHDWQDDRRSPITAGIDDYTVAEYPYVKLVRDVDSHIVRAYASKDGRAWSFVAELFTPFADAVYAGVATATAATFREARIEEHREGTLYARIERVRDQVTLHWSKPNTAVRFNVYRTRDVRTSTTDPTRSGGWEKVLSSALTFSHRDENLRYGTAYFKVTVVGADGVERPGSRTLVATAEPISVVLAEAERLSAADYTKGSYHLLTTAIAEVKDALSTPGYDEEALVNRVYAAVSALVPVGSLLRKAPIEPSMVEASTVLWPGIGTTAENGWRAFDGDLATSPDTLQAVSWIDVRLPNPIALDGIRFHPRPTHVARSNGTIIQGSNDDGATWTDLYTIGGVVAAKWYEIPLPRTAAYQRLRIYDGHDGRANLAEIEFLRLINDATLLDVFVAEAKAVDQSAYTEESVAALAASLAHGEAVLANENATQADIDAAADRLRAAIANLVPR